MYMHYIYIYIYIYREREKHIDICYMCFSPRATHEARCFSQGYYLTGKVNGHKMDSKGTLCSGILRWGLQHGLGST